MKKFAIVAAFLVVGIPITATSAMTVAPLKGEDQIVVVAKKGGSSRSAKSGRFVTRSYMKRNRSTTVTHRKY
jgi:hypothetical protein